MARLLDRASALADDHRRRIRRRGGSPLRALAPSRNAQRGRHRRRAGGGPVSGAVRVRDGQITMAAGARLDFDGIAKGYAVDVCVDRLRAAGVSRALVSLGESSLYALGAPDGAAHWRLAVRGPDPETQVGWLGLRDAGASVSATFGSAGRRPGAVAHIIDPRSGRPLEDDAVAVVVASSATDAEGWTKALLVWGPDGLARARRGGAAAAVHVTAGRGTRRRRARCRGADHLDAAAGAAAHRRPRGAAAMRAFGSSSYLLSDARLEVRLVYTGFLVLALVGMATVALFQVTAIGPAPAQIAAYFRGGERHGAMTFEKTFRELVELTHFHAFVMGLVYLVMAHLMVATSASEAVKRAMIILALAGLVGDIVGVWLIRYVSGGFAYAQVLSWIAEWAGFSAFVYYPLREMWFRDGRAAGATD